MSVFAGGGWALAGAAYNIGGELRIPTKGRTSPFLTVMYGYNAVITIKDRKDLSGIYYGPTIGGGLMVRQASNRNYWRFSLNVPIRGDEFWSDYNALKARPDIEIKQDILPVSFGVGYHIFLSTF